MDVQIYAGNIVTMGKKCPVEIIIDCIDQPVAWFYFLAVGSLVIIP